MLLIILLIALITRVLQFYKIPGLDVDEAMGGINSWSVGKYGVDYFNRLKNPVYLFAWGSGMNILYPLLTVPLVKLFGLSLFVYRGPLIFINMISYFVFVAACIKGKMDDRKILLITCIVLLSPWSIQTTRFAVESNLFPTLMLFVISFFVFFINSENDLEKTLYLTLMTFMLGVSSYAYSNNWIFLAVFSLLMFTYLFYRKEISIRQLTQQFILLIVIVFPLLLFIYVNYIKHESIYFLGLGIPKLAATRSAFIVCQTHPLHLIVNNVMNTFKMFISGYDGVTKIATPQFGAFYPFMVTFAIIGVIKTIHFKNSLHIMMFIMLISSFINILIIEASWTHFNSMMFPILYFEAIGVDRVFRKKAELQVFFIAFLVMLLLFCNSYFVKYGNFLQNGEQNTPNELQQYIKLSARKRNVYIISSKSINNTNSGALFVLPLFYTHFNPYIFHHQTKDVREQEFMSYNDYGKWHICNSDKLKYRIPASKNSSYIMQNGISKKYIPLGAKLTQKGKYYSLYTCQ